MVVSRGGPRSRGLRFTFPCRERLLLGRCSRTVKLAVGPLLAATAVVSACLAATPTSPTPDATMTAPRPSETTAALAAASPSTTIVADGICPVTRPAPPSAVPQGVIDTIGPGTSESASHADFQNWYGNDALWVGLYTEGARQSEKFWWVRLGRGKLTITGRRLDAEAPPAVGHVPDGYGETGFQASGIDFPTGGCWEVTGTLARNELRFVLMVLSDLRFASDPPEMGSYREGSTLWRGYRVRLCQDGPGPLTYVGAEAELWFRDGTMLDAQNGHGPARVSMATGALPHWLGSRREWVDKATLERGECVTGWLVFKAMVGPEPVLLKWHGRSLELPSG
jgi:hypothetical protein